MIQDIGARLLQIRAPRDALRMAHQLAVDFGPDAFLAVWFGEHRGMMLDVAVQPPSTINMPRANLIPYLAAGSARVGATDIALLWCNVGTQQASQLRLSMGRRRAALAEAKLKLVAEAVVSAGSR